MPEPREWDPCPQCNGWIAPDARYCENCGAARRTPESRRRGQWLIAGGGVLAVMALGVVAAILLTGPARPVGAAASTTPRQSPVATPIPATPSPGPTQTPAPATPAATPAAPTPTPEPVIIAGLEPLEAARILETLNVRSKPGLGYALVSARSPADGSVVDDEVQAAAGTYVWIENGPVLNDGYAWYRVYPISYDPQAPFWDGKGWIASGAGGVAWLAEDEPPPPPSPGPGECCPSGGYQTVHIAGLGSGISDELFGSQPYVEWDATDHDAGPCDLVARLVDVETGDVYVVVEETIGSAPETGSWGGYSQQGTFQLEVDSTCSWSILVTFWGT